MTEMAEVMKDFHEHALFENEMEQKRKGVFAVPAAWKNERGKDYESCSTDVVDVYIFNDYSFPRLVFTDPFAPYGVNRGVLLNFKEQSESARNQLVLADKACAVLKKEKRGRADGTSLKNAGGKGFLVTALIANTFLWFQSFSYFTEIPFAGVIVLNVVASIVLTMLMFATGFLTYDLRGKIGFVSENRKKVLEQKENAKFTTAASLAKTDELFFLGKNSLIPKIVNHSDAAAIMVRDKLRTNPSDNELQGWAKVVLEIFELAETLKDPFPVGLIPLMMEDASEVRDDLKKAVNNLKKEWISSQRRELVAVSHGQELSTNIEEVSVGSKASREGAKRYLENLKVSDMNDSVSFEVVDFKQVRVT